MIVEMENVISGAQACYAWCLRFDTLGGHGAIQGHLGAQERKPWGRDLDSVIDFVWIFGPHVEVFCYRRRLRRVIAAPPSNLPKQSARTV